MIFQSSAFQDFNKFQSEQAEGSIDTSTSL